MELFVKFCFQIWKLLTIFQSGFSRFLPWFFTLTDSFQALWFEILGKVFPREQNMILTKMILKIPSTCFSKARKFNEYGLIFSFFFDSNWNEDQNFWHSDVLKSRKSLLPYVARKRIVGELPSHENFYF